MTLHYLWHISETTGYQLAEYIFLQSHLNHMRLYFLLWTKILLSVKTRYDRQVLTAPPTYLCSREGENPRQQCPLRWQDRTEWYDPPAHSLGCSCSGFCPQCWTWSLAGGHWVAVQDYHKCSWAVLERGGENQLLIRQFVVMSASC